MVPDFLRAAAREARLLYRDLPQHLSIGLVVGACLFTNLLVLTLADSLLWAPIAGVERPQELVSVFTDIKDEAFLATSFPDFEDIRSRTRSLADLAAVAYADAVIEEDGLSATKSAAIVTPNYFDLLGVRALRGRLFSGSDRQAKVAILSERLWRQLAGPRESGLGSVRLNGQRYLVAGVCPGSFSGTSAQHSPDIWIPAAQHRDFLAFPDLLTGRQWRTFHLIGRIRPPRSLAQVQEEVQQISAQLAMDHPETNQDVRFSALAASYLRPSERTLALKYALAFGTLSSLFLLVGLSYAALLIFNQAHAHRKSMILRSALGARWIHFLPHLLVRTAAYFLLSWAAVEALSALTGGIWVRLLIPGIGALPSQASIADGPWHILALTIMGGILLSAIMVACNGKGSLQQFDQLGARQTAIPAELSRLSGLMTLQVGFCSFALLLSFAAWQVLGALSSRERGFEPENVLAVTVSFPPNRFSMEKSRGFWMGLLEGVRESPTVASAALCSTAPTGPVTHGWAEDPAGRRHPIEMTIVGADYFKTLSIPIIAGEAFRPGSSASRAVIVNQRFKDSIWSEREIVGQPLRLSFGLRFQDYRVVGVALDTVTASLGQAPSPHAFVVNEGAAARFRMLAKPQTGKSALSLLEVVERVAAGLDPHAIVSDAIPLEEYVEGSMLFEQAFQQISSVLGLSSLLLALVGAYHLARYRIRQCSRELAIRASLGASPLNLSRWQLKAAALPILLGLGLGTACGFAVLASVAGLSAYLAMLDFEAAIALNALLALCLLGAILLGSRQALRFPLAQLLKE